MADTKNTTPAANGAASQRNPADSPVGPGIVEARLAAQDHEVDIGDVIDAVLDALGSSIRDAGTYGELRADFAARAKARAKEARGAHEGEEG